MNPTSTTRHLRQALPAALLVMFCAITAQGANDFWAGGSGDFNVNGNWLDNTAPTDTGIALFNTAGPYTVTFPVHEVTNQLHVNATSVTFDLNGKTYSNDGILFGSPSFIAIGDTANGSLALTSGLAGAKLAADSAQIGNATYNGTLTVGANVTFDIAGAITLGDFGTLGTLVLDGGNVEAAEISMFGGSGALTYNSGNLTITDTAFFDTGSAIVVNNGTLAASGFTSFSQGLTVNAGGVVNLSNNSHNVSGAGVSLTGGGSLNLISGSLSTSAISGTIGWTGGTVLYGNNLSIGTGEPLGSSITLSNKSLTVNTGGSITIQSGGSLTVNKTTHGALSADAIIVMPGGNFEYGGSGGSITLNTGDLTIGTGQLTGLSDADTVSIGNGGNITLTNGTLTIDEFYTLETGGGTLNTSMLINNGTLTYNGGSLLVQFQPLIVGGGSGGGHINGDTSITIGFGDNLSTQSSLTIDDTYTVTVNNGTLQAESGINVAGELTLNDGTIEAGFGGNIGVAGTGSLEINGGFLSAGSLSTAPGGTTTFNGGAIAITSGSLTIGDGGINAPAPVVLNSPDSISITGFGGTLTIDPGRTLSIQGGSLQTQMLDDTIGSTLEFHSGQLQIMNDDLEIGPNGVDGTEPTVVNAGSTISVAPSGSGGGELSVVSGRELQISGGFVTAQTLNIAGKATFNNGTLWLTGDGENLRIVDPTSGDDGISDTGGTVAINSNSSIRVTEGSVTIDAGQALHLNGGELHTKSIAEDSINSFTYTGGTLFLHKSNLVIGPDNELNDQRLLGASPVLDEFDNVSIEDNDFFEAITVGNTTIETGGSLSINGGNFYTTANLTIEEGGSLSGNDPNSIPYGGLGGFTGIPDFYPGSLMTNNGDVSPGYAGQAIGELHYTGDYLQGTTGDLHLQLHSFMGFEQSDRLTIGGAATLGGTLTISLNAGYDWTAGDVFDLLIADGGIINEFDAIDHPALPPGYFLDFDYGYNGGTTLRLTVTPEPTSGVLMLLNLLGITIFSRRNRNRRGCARNRIQSAI